MREEPLSVSVVICAYTHQRWQALGEAVASIQQQRVSPREIIVVIDHNPTLLQRVRQELRGVISIENQQMRGLSGARNSGIARARGNLIAFLDDDAVAEEDWLERLVVCCQDERVLGAGGTVEPLWEGKRPAWFPQEFAWVVGCSYQQRLSEPIEVRNPYGGCTCMRREVFEQVGGFRSGLGRVGTRPLGGEETELCIRARQRWPRKYFLYEPRARIHHRVGASRATLGYFVARCYAEGLSKALIARYVGANDGLAAERNYTLKMLPKGIMKGVQEALVEREITGLLRAGAILAGLIVTSTGYLIGSLSDSSALNEASGAASPQKFSQKTSSGDLSPETSSTQQKG